ncbi:MAG: hypothetical protein ACD_26C00150G0005 [uncultured bacterium]|nr:MAG: hypothetical protein ACD_26C00150G0005 [uncultured bacterium]
MLYSVLEASKLLNVTRKTIYDKINVLKEIKTEVKTKNNIKYLTEQGISLIRLSLTKQNDYTESNENLNDNLCDSYIKSDSPSYTDIHNLIETLKNELIVKNKQIESLTDALSHSQKLNENNQVLLQQSHQKVFLLEQKKEEKPWWKKIFS